MKQKRKLLVVVSLLSLLLVLSGCLGLLKKYDLTVKLVDKFGTAISGSVTLTELDSTKSIDTKEGSSVIFTDLKPGTYKVTAVYHSTNEEGVQNIVLEADQTVTVKFDTVSSVASVQKYKFEPTGDAQTLSIKNLGANEHLLVGVSILDFDPSKLDEFSFAINMDRVDSGQDQNITLSDFSTMNPEYIYRPVPQYDVPKIQSVDLQLRSIEKQLQEEQPEIPPLPSFGPDVYTLGDQKSFNFQNFETGNWVQKTTTVRGVGEHCYIFVENTADFITEDMINSYIEEFDNQIFPTNTSFFNDGFDIDQNDKMGIVLLDMEITDFSQGIVMGYFWGIDFYTQEELDSYGLYTNKGDFIYINAQAIDPEAGMSFTVEDHFSTIAHEFQHELWNYATWENGWGWSDDWVSDSWINEGMSTYAEQINGYSLVDDRIYIYFDNASPYLADTAVESLVAWERNLSDYGISNLFTNYIVEQFSEDVLHDIYTTAQNPVQTIADFTNMSFEDIFMNFTIANKLHSLNLAPEYSYELPLEADPGHAFITSNWNGVTIPFRTAAVKYFIIEGTGTDIELSMVGTAARNQKLGVFTYRY